MRKVLLSGLVALGTLTSVSLFSATANAGGFLADTFIRPFSPEAADAADQANAALGNPVDHAAAAAADYFVPGSGRALEAGWAIQRSGILNGAPSVGGGPIGQPRSFPMQPRLGNVCVTPAGNYPGPFNPVGAFCVAQTPWGPVQGQVW
jgi:hypothetical protein